MKDFLHELIIIGTSVGTLAVREVIALILKYFNTPKEVRIVKKHNKHQTKANTLKSKLKEKETQENAKENN